MTTLETFSNELIAQLRDYQGMMPLGRGGFASVYAARRRSDGMDVAIKVAARRGDPRFAREEAALQRLPKGVGPELIDSGKTGSHHPYLVMSRLRGPSLADWLHRQNPTLAEKLAVGALLARVVNRMHDAGIIHRDLKPENILLVTVDDGKLEPRIIDFGLARFVENAETLPLLADMTTEGSQLGTALYMAPEQCEGKKVDASADIYSLGVVLFELVTGRPPFEGDAFRVIQAHAMRKAPAPSRLVQNLPADVDAIVLGCLAKRREERPARGDAIAAALDAAALKCRAAASMPPPAQAPSTRPAATGPAGTNSTSTMAILSVRTTVPFTKIMGTLDEPDVVLAGAVSGGLLLVFTDRPSPLAGVMAAQRVAARIQHICKQMVIHVAPIAVRKGPRGTTCLGAALSKANVWSVRHHEPGVKLTADALAVLGNASAESAGKSASVSASAIRGATASAANEPAPVELERATMRGRNELVTSLMAEIREGLSKGEPGLATVVGEVGLGKTRFVEELAVHLHEGGMTTCIVRPSAPEGGDVESASRSLARYALQLEEGQTSVDEVRRRCLEIDADLGEESWPAVANVFGSLSEGAAELGRLRGTPGAARRAFSRLIGRAIGVRATKTRSVLLVDDAQWADPAALDALEIATLGHGTDAPWIVVVTSPALPAQRAAWAERAVRHPRWNLEPLPFSVVREVLAELLTPIDMIPELVLDELARAAEGVPLYAVELVHTLLVSGRIRKRHSTDSFFLAADEIKGTSNTPLAERLARRAREGLSEDLELVLQIAAVLGNEVEPAEISAVQDILANLADPARDAGMMDPYVGCERLARRRIVLPVEGGKFRFRHAMLREGLLHLFAPASRRRLHAAALQFVDKRNPEDARTLARIARHAEGSGAHARAAEAYLALADSAARRHRLLEAEANYSAALGFLEPASFAQERAYAGRGQARALIDRYDDAILDLERAVQLATGRNDKRTEADLLLDLATLHDLRSAYDASAAAMERAATIVDGLDEPRLSARVDAARGRTLRRRGKTAEAIVRLERGATGAAAHGDTRTQCEALLLLSTSLVMAGRVGDAEQRFAEVIQLAERIGDRFHYGVAHCNRIVLWIKLQEHERAVVDQRVALMVARELGNATLEAFASANVAELLYFAGDYVDALPLARRMDVLLRRLNGRLPTGALVIRARLEAVIGDRQIARDLLLPAAADEPKFVTTMRRLVELLIQGTADGWDDVIDALFECAETDESLDAVAHAARATIAAGRLDDARRYIRRGFDTHGGPAWQRRFEALAAVAA